jgi:hypothetical protein
VVSFAKQLLAWVVSEIVNQHHPTTHCHQPTINQLQCLPDPEVVDAIAQVGITLDALSLSCHAHHIPTSTPTLRGRINTEYTRQPTIPTTSKQQQHTKTQQAARVSDRVAASRTSAMVVSGELPDQSSLMNDLSIRELNPVGSTTSLDLSEASL